MARRKKRVEEHENHERWLVSYADFITLLFAFFVVMYAISSVNEGKYRVLSDTMVEAFSEKVDEQGEQKMPLMSDQASQGEFVGRSQDKNLEAEQHEQQSQHQQNRPADIPPTDNRMWVVASNLDSALQGFVDQGLVKINMQGDRVEVQLSSKMLFSSGSASLALEARKALRDIAIIIRPLDNEIMVEGHTDDIPISTQAFPSNWELSSSRAAAVVDYMSREGVDPSRMAAIGYGEFRPISSNDTPEGRAKNRRVTLVLKSANSNPYGNLQQSPQTDEPLPWAESPGGV